MTSTGARYKIIRQAVDSYADSNGAHEQLATPQAHRRSHDVQGVEPMSLGGGEKLADLVDGQPPSDLEARRGHADQLGNDARHELLAHRVLERVTKDGVHEPDLSSAGISLTAATQRTAPPINAAAPVEPTGAAQAFVAKLVHEGLDVLDLQPVKPARNGPLAPPEAGASDHRALGRAG